MNENSTGHQIPEKAFDSKERQSYIAPGGLYLFLSPLSKREGVYTYTRLLGSGVKPQQDDHLVNRITFDLEEETEAINGMGSVDTTRACNSNKHLKEYKTYFGDSE